MITPGEVGFRHKKIVLRIVAVLLASLMLAAIVCYALLSSKIHSILQGNPIDLISNSQPLKNIDGQTNILIFGMSYDDPNPTHTAGYLTDSLIVLSIDQNRHTAHTISIPRDLWVKYETTCNLGNVGKINAAYICALDSTKSKDRHQASRILANKVSDVTGLPIQYYLEVNYTFIRTLTDAINGIDVEAYSSDPRGIKDNAVGLELPAGTNHLDGKTALKLARARNSHGGYGLPRSNFDREINQQRIIGAIFKKISSNGDLGNFNYILKLVDALSGYVSTDINTKELKDALRIAKSINPDNVVSVPIDDYMSTDRVGQQSIVRPASGLENYSAVREYIKQQVSVVK